jgi:hypothetical protein
MILEKSTATCSAKEPCPTNKARRIGYNKLAVAHKNCSEYSVAGLIGATFECGLNMDLETTGFTYPLGEGILERLFPQTRSPGQMEEGV